MKQPLPLHIRFAPNNFPAASRNPLLVLLHGRGSDENDLLALTPFLDPRFLIASVRAPFPFSFGGHTWYELFEIGRPNMGQLVESHALLLRTIDHLVDAHPVDPARIFLFGFSMGAMMSFVTALANPGRIRGVVAHSGYIPEGTPMAYHWDALKATSFFIAHGTDDPIVPVSMARRARELLLPAGVDLTYREYPIGHTIADESLTDAAQWLREHEAAPG